MAEMAEINRCVGVTDRIESILTSFSTGVRPAHFPQTGLTTLFTNRGHNPTTIDAARPSDAPPKLAFDPDALRDKCRAERDRRLRDDGNEQYQEIKGRFA